MGEIAPREELLMTGPASVSSPETRIARAELATQPDDRSMTVLQVAIAALALAASLLMSLAR